MHYVVEDTAAGDGGAAVKMAHECGGESFCHQRDALTEIDLTALVRHHREAGNEVDHRAATRDHRWSSACGDRRRRRIVRFLEKPSWGEVFSDTINTGIYVLEPGILDV